MRLSGPGEAGPRAAPTAGRQGFGAALRRASQGGKAREVGRAEARRSTSAERRGAPARRRSAPLDPGPAGRSPLAGGEAAGAPVAAGAAAIVAGREAGGPVEAARAWLALAVRGVVPAVEIFRQSGRAALTLDLGPALGVELRRVDGGVALALSVTPALAPAARAELPHLLRTLAARGVAVVGAEVRERRGAAGSRR